MSTDEMDNTNSETSSARRHWIGAAVSLSVLGLVGAGGWYVYAQGTGPDLGTSAPLILSSDKPVKVVPKDAGGLKVPHRNVEVYARIERSTPGKSLKKATPKAESLLPPPVDLTVAKPTPADSPDNPIARTTTGPAAVSPNGVAHGDNEAGRKERLTLAPATPAKTAPEKEPEKNTEKAAFQPAAVPAAMKPHVPDLARPSVRPSVPEAIAAIPLVVPKKARPVRTAAAPPKRTGPRTTADLIGPYRIQIGAYRNPMQAHSRWSRLKRRHRDLLGNMVMVIERVNLGPRGVMYRLQAGPMQTPGAVKSLCGKLGKRRVGCILVRG